MRPFASALAIACIAAPACHSPGPYGHSRTYAPTSDETRAVAGHARYEPRPSGSPDARKRAPVWLFGVVTHRGPGPGGAAYVALSLRTVEPRNACGSNDEDSCRVTVSDRESGRAHALLSLTAEDELGERSVGLGSLLRVVGDVTEDVDPNDGTPVLRATFYRHWPRGFYATPSSPGSPRR